MTVKVGINGFGRIGRQVLKAIKERAGDTLEVVAINDLFDTKTNASLFKYDLNYGMYPGTVEIDGNDLVIDGKKVKVFAEKDPGALPWAELGVEIVIEFDGYLYGCQERRWQIRGRSAHPQRRREESDHQRTRQERGPDDRVGRE